MLRKAALAVSAVAIVLSVACGKSKEEKAVERQIEKQTGGKVDVNLAKDKVDMKIKTDEGDIQIASGGGAEIPKNFPKDVLVYKGASVVMSATQEQNMMLTLQTKDDAKKVLEAYKKAMASQGWEEKGSFSLPVGTTIQYEKDKRSATVSIGGGADNQTQIQLMVGTEE